MKTARFITMQALVKMEKSSSYSNLTIEPLLRKSNLDNRDKRFAYNMFYGVLENKILLDHIIQKHSKLELSKISLDVLNILRMGIYQLLYLDLKDFAAVNESVTLTKDIKKKSAAGFVNAVLRQFLRENKQISLPNKQKEFKKYLSVKYSCPEWLAGRLTDEYGKEKAESFLDSQVGKPPLAIRVNTALTTPEDLIEQFESQNIDAELHSYIDNCIVISNSTDIINTPQFMQGLFHVQDVSSQICSIAAASYNPASVLDCCAAPGGKSFTISQELAGKAKITSCDLHEHRVKLISSGAERLKLSNIRASAQNASEYNPNLGEFGLVLCDVPCSGFGVIRRKPEIKYKAEESIKSLPGIQYKILNTASNYVKQDGILIYSTCTVLPEENQQVIQRFLDNNSNFQLCDLPRIIKDYYTDAVGHITMLPDKLDNDGFYICAMKRKEESI